MTATKEKPVQASIYCRYSGCRRTLDFDMAIGQKIETILRVHGWARSRDELGFYCPEHRPEGDR